MHLTDLTIIAPEAPQVPIAMILILLFGGIILGVSCIVLSSIPESIGAGVTLVALGFLLILGAIVTPGVVYSNVPEKWYTETAELLNLESDLEALREAKLFSLVSEETVATAPIASQSHGAVTLHVDGRVLTLKADTNETSEPSLLETVKELCQTADPTDPEFARICNPNP